MPSHLKIVTALSSCRSLIGVALAAFIFWKMRTLEEIASGDRVVLLSAASLLLLFSVVRACVAVGGVLRRRWSRRLGLALAAFDCVNLVLFPLSTALGLQGLVVYRHPETVHYFGHGEAAAGRSDRSS